MARYKFNPETKELELIDSRRGNIPGHVYFPKDCIHSGHKFENLGEKTFGSASEKRDYMKKNHIEEAG